MKPAWRSRLTALSQVSIEMERRERHARSTLGGARWHGRSLHWWRRLMPAIGLAVLSSGCALSKLQAPAITPLSVELTDVQVNEQNFKVRLDVQNPNDRPLPIKSATCTLEIQGVNVGKGESAAPFTVPAHGDIEVDLLVTTNLLVSVPDLFQRLFQRVLQQGTLPDYHFSGWINPDIALVPPIPFSKSGQITLPKSWYQEPVPQ